MGNNNSQVDCQTYIDRYPNKQEPPLSIQSNNLDFYTNQIPSQPDNVFIDVLHEEWYGDYEKLEKQHGFIQWIFPIRERGMNPDSFPLTLDEIKAIVENKQAKARVIISYKLILDFYGICLDNEETGELSRAANWESRFLHLNHSFHNFLRITRILKSLGELDFEHYKKPLILFLLQEIFVYKTLPRLSRSCQDFWIPILRVEEERRHCKDLFHEFCKTHPIITDEDKLDEKYAKKEHNHTQDVIHISQVDGSVNDDDGYAIGLDLDGCSDDEEEKKSCMKSVVDVDDKEEVDFDPLLAPSPAAPGSPQIEGPKEVQGST